MPRAHILTSIRSTVMIPRFLILENSEGVWTHCRARWGSRQERLDFGLVLQWLLLYSNSLVKPAYTHTHTLTHS